MTFIFLASRDAVAARRASSAFLLTAVVVLTLALGLAANVAVFSVLGRVLLKPLSYPRAEELVALRQIAPGVAGLFRPRPAAGSWPRAANIPPRSRDRLVMA